MLSDLREAGASVIYECDARLVSIFSRSMPWLSVVPLMDHPHPDLLDGSIDFRVSAGSLGRWFRPSSSHFHPLKKMLLPDPVLTRQYRDQYRQLGDGLIIGISWRSNSPNHADRKSIPIDQWGPVLTTRDCHFISLQYGDVDTDVSRAAEIFNVDIFADKSVSALNSLEQSAAQVAAVDLVISISNATVHLSGACATPTWALLGEKPLWHWFLNRESSLWYDSVRLYRQESEGDWAPLMKDIAAWLSGFPRD